MSKVIKIEGMSCEKCVAHVKEALEDIAGIENVTVDLKEGKAVVEGSNVSDEVIKEAIEDEGYDVISIM
ncbi:cation transporter [Clostridium bornimense]|uniref:heavy-metal-associated domain-containing protein n=1 Tax=Clostridium bornimense TaxID=1216932 RepID=UPI001C1109A2|nr:cation transporter [Clostridium bornimense]MBU5316490.1 cation transporter [Clostridium bornimense]